MGQATTDLKSKMKSGLGGLKPKQSLFESTAVEEPVVKAPPVRVSQPAPKVTNLEDKATHTPKADLFTERVTAVISTSQRDALDSLAKKIQRNGIKKPSRITTNSVIRALVSLVESFDGDISSISNEDDLHQALRNYLKK